MTTLPNPLPRWARLAWTAMLMAAFALALYTFARRLPSDSPGENIVFITLALLAGNALGGALGARLSGAGWPDLLLASALSAALLAVVILVIVPGLSRQVAGGGPLLQQLAQEFLLVFLTASAGVFILALFDPLVRQRGPAPPVLVLALVALALAGLLFLADLLLLGGGFTGLITLVVGGLAALALAGLGLLLSLFRAYLPGAWSGGLAILLWAFAILAWYASGQAWFP